MSKFAKAHPFGYIPIKKKEDRSTKSLQKKYLQVVRMKNGQVRTIQHYY